MKGERWFGFVLDVARLFLRTKKDGDQEARQIGGGRRMKRRAKDAADRGNPETDDASR